VNAIQLYGGLGSPYSMKIRALCRYRHIPFVWTQIDDAHHGIFGKVKVPVIPIIAFPDGVWMNDSTPLASELETRYPNDRSALPPNPAQRFISLLLEDFADEWVTKIMFHYRWYRARDQQQLGHWLAFDRLGGKGDQAIRETACWFMDRQVERMPLVGCTPENAPLIEASYAKLLETFERHLPNQHYLFGARPSVADFAFLGQLSQLASDPTSADIMRDTAPSLMRWLVKLDDASGVTGHWDEANLSPLVVGLLSHMGETYMPFMLSNFDALEQGSQSLSIKALGLDYQQAPFPYQRKCLLALRAAYANLAVSTKSELAPVLDEAGLLHGLTTP
jgi:glutathione S-transferase